MTIALSKLVNEDPSLKIRINEENGQTLLCGMGELHLEIILDRIKREFLVDICSGSPQVSYRETITKSYEIDYIHKKQTGGAGQFARLKLMFQPLEISSNSLLFDNKIVGGAIPKEYIPVIKKSIEQTSKLGAFGYQMTSLRVTLLDGDFHDVDSSSLAFEIASRTAFKHGIKKSCPILLEPIMKVEINTPEQYLGAIIGSICSLRGRVISINYKKNNKFIICNIPLASMFGYINTLRYITQGRAQYSMNFSRYEKVPQHISSKIIDQN